MDGGLIAAVFFALIVSASFVYGKYLDRAGWRKHSDLLVLGGIVLAFGLAVLVAWLVR